MATLTLIKLIILVLTYYPRQVKVSSYTNHGNPNFLTIIQFVYYILMFSILLQFIIYFVLYLTAYSFFCYLLIIVHLLCFLYIFILYNLPCLTTLYELKNIKLHNVLNIIGSEKKGWQLSTNFYHLSTEPDNT